MYESMYENSLTSPDSEKNKLLKHKDKSKLQFYEDEEHGDDSFA